MNTHKIFLALRSMVRFCIEVSLAQLSAPLGALAEIASGRPALPKSTTVLLKCVILFSSVTILSGCTSHRLGNIFPFSKSSGSGASSHIVRREGETLATIAQEETGNSVNWRAILAENPDVNPRRLRVGQRIMIPNRLRKRAASRVATRTPVSRPEAARAAPADTVRDTEASSLVSSQAGERAADGKAPTVRPSNEAERSDQAAARNQGAAGRAATKDGSQDKELEEEVFRERLIDAVLSKSCDEERK